MFDFGEPVSGGSGLQVYQYIEYGLIPIILAVVALVIHIAFAFGVFKDASARRDAERHLWFVVPIFWAGAVLVGSVFVAAVYWLMHYSNLVSNERSPEKPTDEV